MNVVNIHLLCNYCLEIFCMHSCVLAELKSYKYYSLDVWRNHNFLGQRSLNSINKLLFYKYWAANLYPKLLIFPLLLNFSIHSELILSRCITYLFASLTVFRWLLWTNHWWGRGGGREVLSKLSLRDNFLDDCTRKTNNKRKVGKPIYYWIVFSSAFQKSTFQRHRMKMKKIWPLEDNILIFCQALVKTYLLLHLLMDNELVWLC